MKNICIIFQVNLLQNFIVKYICYCTLGVVEKIFIYSIDKFLINKVMNYLNFTKHYFST